MKRSKAYFSVFLSLILLLSAVWAAGVSVFSANAATYTAGDVNQDGKITAADARLALRCAVGLESYAAGSNRFNACDVNRDGKVTAADARAILRGAVGLDDPAKWKEPVTPGNTTGAFKIGLIGPLTGAAAIYGNAVKNGAQLAVNELNAKGGVRISLNALDDAHDAEQAVNAYNALLDWGMQALVGPVTSRPAISVAAQAERDRVFCLTPTASSADVTENNNVMYQVCYADPNQGAASADYIAAHFRNARVAVIYKQDDAYSVGIRDTFVAEAGVKGLNVVYEGVFTDYTSTDFSVQLAFAQNARADVMFLPMYYEPASIILKQSADIGYNPTFFGTDGIDGILDMDGFDPSLAEGVMMLTPFAADDPKAAAFVAAYQKAYGETPNQFAAEAYDAVYIIYNALTAAGCTPDMPAAEICEVLISQMSAFSYNGVTGQNMTWNRNGAVSKTPTAIVIKNGVYVSP